MYPATSNAHPKLGENESLSAVNLNFRYAVAIVRLKLTNAAFANKEVTNVMFIASTVAGSLTEEQKIKVAGIVFWTISDANPSGNTPAKLSDDKVMAADFPCCTHGLIVSLKDVATSQVWQNDVE